MRRRPGLLTTRHSHLASAHFVNFFRSSLLIAIVSLLVLSGYASELVCDCHDEQRQEMTGHGDSHSSPEGDCHCVCHHNFSDTLVIPPSAAAIPPVVRTTFLLVDEFPPDTVPPGIDYPPQLA
jgi:hypothetical protein